MEEVKDPAKGGDGLGLESRKYDALEHDFQEASPIPAGPHRHAVMGTCDR